jgi:hypothetical protein
VITTVLSCLAVVLVACSTLPVQPIDRFDPRFAACGGGDDALAAFPLDASEYPLHFPAMGLAPELDGGGPAFAVVFGPDYVPATFGGGQPQPADEGSRYVCIYLGRPPGGTANIYGPVDITGFQP